jgi:hypothetical protein
MMTSKSFAFSKWIGKVMLGSHVAAGGLQWHPGLHSCLNLIVMFFSSPSGVTLFVPVINLYNVERLFLDASPSNKKQN